LALLFFVVAVFSKESAYVLPVVVLLLEAALMRPRRWLPVAVFFGLAALCFLYRWFVFGGIGGYREASGASSALHVTANTFKALLLRAPAETLFGLNWLQPTKQITILIAVGIAALLLPLCIYPVRKLRQLSWFAIGWILVAPVPAHSMARVGADLGNSRELYFASAGTAILLALLVANIVQVHLRRIACALLALVFSFGACHNLVAWQFDSAMSRRLPAEIIRLYPQPPPRTEFEITGLPRSFRGIYFYQTGLEAAVQLAYRRNDIAVHRSSDPQDFPETNKAVVKLCFLGDRKEEGELAFCQKNEPPALSP